MNAPLEPLLIAARDLRDWALRALLLAALLPMAAHARNLGVIGPAYPIAEPDLLEEIQAVLREKEASGELAKLREQAKQRVIARIEHPAPVTGLARAKTPRTHYFDPSVSFAEPIVNDKGEVLIPAGTRANPLDTVTMTRQLLFFDARDPQQVARAKFVMDEMGGKVKPIATGGPHLDLMRAWQIQVYFDQGGRLTKQLGITQVPALVYQEGKRLRVDEIAISEAAQ